MATMFHFDPDTPDAGTSLVNEVSLAPAFLVERFGPPQPGDGSRCTGRYTFVDAKGNVFTVYEYKSTGAYLDDEDDAPSPEEFWRSPNDRELSVGGRGSYRDGSDAEFLRWLLAEHHRWSSARPRI